MSDNSMTINLQAPVFSAKEEEWMEFIVKCQEFLAMKGCVAVIQANFKSKLPSTEDEEFDASTKIEKVIKLAKKKCGGNGIPSMFEQHGNIECNI